MTAKRARRKTAGSRKVAKRGAAAGVLTPRALMAQAEIARANAYAPYSRFAVGAALQTASGRVYHGCNVENASFGLTVCAERNAVFKAVSEGERAFLAIAITAGPEKPSSPCGACRQVLHEFAPDLTVCWHDAHGALRQRPLRELLAMAFDLPAMEDR